jgi:hypothetical protein
MNAGQSSASRFGGRGEGKRASGKLCLVLSGIARAHLNAGNTKSAAIRVSRRVIVANFAAMA